MTPPSSSSPSLALPAPPFPPVADLVPHELPTLVLEELVHWELGAATLRFTVREHGLLVHDGRVDACAALEWMAQGAAACLGHEAFRGGEGVRVGMVVGCRKLLLRRDHFLVGEPLVVAVRRTRGSDFASTFEGEVRDRTNETVATAAMTLVHGAPPAG
jgi:predicted hotdog family 3-hydroxylacyl-ACP dehydratase